MIYGTKLNVANTKMNINYAIMEVFVEVLVEDITKTESPKVALIVFFTMVAMDKNGNSISVLPLEIINDEEYKLFEEGKKRYLGYKQKRS